MKSIKIAAVIIAISFLTGCAGMDTSGYQERAVQRKCQESANRTATNAYIRRESDIRFADDRQDAQKAVIVFQKKMAGIESSYNRCLNNGYKRIFEQALRRQTTQRW